MCLPSHPISRYGPHSLALLTKNPLLLLRLPAVVRSPFVRSAKFGTAPCLGNRDPQNAFDLLREKVKVLPRSNGQLTRLCTNIRPESKDN